MLWLAPALPLLGFLVLALFGDRMKEGAIGAIAVGAVTGAFVVIVASAVSGSPVEHLWTWFRIGDFAPSFSLRLDALSTAFALVISGIGALIHLYATAYMHDDPSFARFFAYMNLFVAAMLTLVLADDLLLLYLGWEGVGLCSYLLIGFWYQESANGAAGRKAFVTTRVGDAAFMLGLLTIATTFGTLAIPDVLARAPGTWSVGAPVAVAVAALLLAGALGKSAQLPLHVWLPDAMAGPTPVSALIHAATMVTAGVYLVARTYPIFLLAPVVLDVIAWLGAASMLVGGFASLAQHDLKRLLAYSTMSQVGLMFVALGARAPEAAVFHFFTHAFFKALLFLAAGSVILAMHHQQDIRHMGGLRRTLPVPFWTFLIGSLALAGFPLITAGFYSKDQVIAATPEVSWALWGAAIVGSLLTAAYIFRGVFHVFFGEEQHAPEHLPGWREAVPLVVLAALSIVGGWLYPSAEHHAEAATITAWTASAAAILGIGLAWAIVRRPGPTPGLLQRGFGFDQLYDALLIRPFVASGAWNRGDRVGMIYEALADGVVGLHATLARTHTGRVRAYLGVLVGGVVLLLGIAIWGTT